MCKVKERPTEKLGRWQDEPVHFFSKQNNQISIGQFWQVVTAQDFLWLQGGDINSLDVAESYFV